MNNDCINSKGQQGKHACIPPALNDISGKIVQAAFKVHSTLGPGMFESVYEICLAYELNLMGLKVERQVPVPIIYGDIDIPAGFYLDMLVEGKVIVELKAVEKILSVHRAQIITYLKLYNCRLGLLINFNVPVIRAGIQRFAN
jgi:GxxExxY protein